MTTDKIRAAAQALLDVLYDQRLIPGAKCAAMEALRAAIAEPAQAAPAADAVPVVGDLGAFIAWLRSEEPGVVSNIGDAYSRGESLTYKAYVFGLSRHLAAMEALRQEVARLKANRSAQVAEVMRLVDEHGNSCMDGANAYDSGPGSMQGTLAAVESAVRKLAGGA